MKRILYNLTFLIVLYVTQNQGMIMRNKALISKMVSHFQQKENLSVEPVREKKSEDVLSLMQNVLCRNFPSIPCSMITEDETLRKLIERSIQQIKYKKLHLEKTTPLPETLLTLFPVLNSEDLSKFLQASDTGYYKERKKNRKQKKSITAKNLWSHEKMTKKKKSKESKRTTVFNGRKKIRRFYPHKIKYKDKGVKNVRKDFGDYSEERLSMSVEIPDVNTGKKVSYRMELDDPPVWRIDYMKHGEPNLNMFGFTNDGLKGAITKTGPNVIVDGNVLEQASRKDVLHPDVYIKKNYVRRNVADTNSEGID